jgi:hypothetical protein
MKAYTYVLVRKDISAVQRAVQACHASLHAGFAFDEPEDTPSLVLLQVDDEPALEAAAERLNRYAVAHRLFHEPDFGPMGFSALATAPLTDKKLRYLFAGYEKLVM